VAIALGRVPLAELSAAWECPNLRSPARRANGQSVP
jgi:hypothetical protein